MRSFKLFILILLMVAWVGCDQKNGKSDWNISEQGYLETPGFNVLVFNDYYTEGDQDGIELIHHGDRIANNGYIRVQLPGGEKFPGPETAAREVDKVKKEISATVKVPEFNFNYVVRISPENSSIHLVVDLEKPIPAALKDKVTFDLQLFPVSYQGKTYHLGEQFGVFPVEGLDPMVSGSGGVVKPVAMAQGPKLLIAPEDQLLKLQIEQVKGKLSLIDDRNSSLGGRIIVRSFIPEGVDKGALEWIITPNLLPGWFRNPVISLSRLGYHPAQVKQAVIELDVRSNKVDKAFLRRIGDDGNISEVKSGLPGNWGKFLRYKYAIFDFSEIKTPGIYTVSYGKIVSEPFSITKDDHRKHIWQPKPEIFFPVQMCQMRILDRVRVRHGSCRPDDGTQAGMALIRSDFPELKEPYSYIWQKSEYLMSGAATYIFCVLAADQILNM